MSKYIIEIPDDVQYVLFNGKADNKYYTVVHPIAELEELNSDYINEHFGELQDEAYQKGFEDGKKSIDLGCKDCKYHEDTTLTNPYSECTRAWEDHYTPAPHSDRIEVGDEVKWNSDVIIMTRFYEDGGFNWCDGISQDGRAFHVLAENVRKTGRHFDIQSILGAMKS